MKKLLIIILVVVLGAKADAQNIFPTKLDGCPTSRFCLDCGDVKANADSQKFKAMIARLNKANDYSNLRGKMLFQILVDSVGNACVLSHTDKSNSHVTQNIVSALNDFDGWSPAITKGKPEGKTSFNLSVQIQDGVLSAKIERVDMAAFRKSFDRPNPPQIFNKTYEYKNQNLGNYAIRFWNSGNSNLPDNMDDHLVFDQDNTLWLTVDNGLVKFDGQNFTKTGQDIDKTTDYYAIAVDNSNVKWAYTGHNIYSYDNHKWTRYDKKAIGIDGAYDIVNNAKTGEVFFCADEGLIILKNGVWSSINKNKLKQLPSNRVDFAKRDSKGRIWLGTFSGSVLIDGDKATSFNDGQTVLNGKCITSMDEDENGNVYLGLYEYNRKDNASVNNNEGIAICYPDGQIKQFTTANSGMPFNHVTKVLYDKTEKVLWIATDRAGLVRYDLHGNWENYHNDNSAIPTSYISDMAFDKNGTLYLATRQGLVKLQRR